MADMKWDIEELRGYINQISGEQQELERERSFLENINTEISDAWKGVAGTAFDQHLDINIANFNKLSELITELCEDMDKVISDCYQRCEEEVSGEISKLRNRVM